MAYGYGAVTINQDGTIYGADALSFRDDSSGVLPSSWTWRFGGVGDSGINFSTSQWPILYTLAPYFGYMIPGGHGSGPDTNRTYLPTTLTTDVGSKQRFIEITTISETPQ